MEKEQWIQETCEAMRQAAMVIKDARVKDQSRLLRTMQALRVGRPVPEVDHSGAPTTPASKL